MSFTFNGAAPLFQVFDMPVSVSFYRDKLGFNLVDSSGRGDNSDWVLLKRDNIRLMLNKAYEDGQRPDAPDPLRVKYHGDTTIYFGCPDVDAAYDTLMANGITAGEPYITKYGWKAMDFNDPDGYHLCFHWPLS
jgi:glyoxylase I family protein